VNGRELPDELGSTNRVEKDCLQSYLESLVSMIVSGTLGSCIVDRRQEEGANEISSWDEDDSHQLIIKDLPRAEKITTSDGTEKHKTFPSERFDILSIR
jgi:hypothetical protein